MLRKSILVLMIVVGLAAIGSLFINPLRYSRLLNHIKNVPVKPH